MVKNTSPSFYAAGFLQDRRVPPLGLNNVSPVLIMRKRPDQNGTHRGAFERNKKRIYSTQSICGICGLPVDFTMKYPHPLSPCIDHIIPIAKGGHPSDIDNLQLAHWICNRQKSDKLVIRKEETKEDVGNYNLPWSIDWESYRA